MAGQTLMISIMLFFLTSVFGPQTAAAQGQSMRAAPERVEILNSETPPLPADWIEVESPMATVHAASRDQPTALRLSRHIAASLPRLATTLELAVGNRIHVVLAPTQAEFHSLQPGRAPDWADGTAWPSRGLIFLRAPRLRGNSTEPLETVLDHELVHVLLGRAFGSRSVPRWLQEGVAQLMAGEYSAETTSTLARGVFGDSLLSLYELSRGFPKNPLRANLAYAQSADFVAYLRNTYGQKALTSLIDELARGEAFAPSVRIATGDTVDDIDKAWRARLQTTSFKLTPLMEEGVWWGLGALLVPIAWFAVRRRNRRKIDRWKREEVLEDALYRAIERGFQDPTADAEEDEGLSDEAGPPIWPIQ